jgi:hypothetical protein
VTDDVPLPRVLRIRQSFPRPVEPDLVAAVRRELTRLFAPGSLRVGAEIGITVGSRGIHGIATITRAAVDHLKSLGVRPFIIPAMGSHGGALAEAQAHLVGHYGVTEESMGCPIRASMTTISLGRTRGGVDVRFAEVASKADGILLLNRVKPHTDYKGPIESGLTKICAIGLGKYDGAREIHRHLFELGLGGAIRQVTERIIESGKIVGGLAILENAYHETARIAGVPIAGFFEREAELLTEARGLMGRLPIDEIDVLYCQRLGKNISGAGLDTNIIGRSVYGHVTDEPWCPGMPRITRIVVSDLTDESDGNGVGMGNADYITRRLFDKVDLRITALNAMTACAPSGATTPIVLDDDKEALAGAIRTARHRSEGSRVVFVRDTLALESVWISEACEPLVRGRSEISIELGARPIPFDASGHVELEF